jgi:hypothetical protein
MTTITKITLPLLNPMRLASVKQNDSNQDDDTRDPLDKEGDATDNDFNEEDLIEEGDEESLVDDDDDETYDDSDAYGDDEESS